MDSHLNNLELAKKRDHKIMITDEAINKVPRIKYRGIPENEYDILWDLAKNVLKISKDENDSLSDFSLSDIQFLLKYQTVKMMVVVTNLGNISYLVKNKKYDFGKAITLFNEAVDENNKANNLKDLQDAADYFLKNSYNVGIDYDNR